MGFGPERIAALPWARVMAEMGDLEKGAVANIDEKRQVGHYWLRDPLRAPTVHLGKEIGDTTREVVEFAQGVRNGTIKNVDGTRFTDVIHVGIGGSALGPALVLDAVGEPSKGLRFHLLDNTDPDGIARVLSRISEWRSTLVVVVSKSGGTAETRNGMLLVHEALRARGFDVGPHSVAITVPGSALHKQAVQEGWRKIFPMWDWVGGRTSVTSAVGLLPAELGGVDTEAFLKGAKEMDEWTRVTRWDENPAALLAGAWHVAGNGRGDRAMVVLPYADRLVLLSRYLQQLVMESIGKRLDRDGALTEQGLVVYGNKGSTDQHAYVQQLRDGRDDFFATFVQVLGDGAGSGLEVEPGVNTGDFLQGFLLGTRRALADKGRPSLTITIPAVDALALGSLVALFERTVGFYAMLVNINAYDQPGVEAGKKAANQILGLGGKICERLQKGPAGVEELATELKADAVEVYWICERGVQTGRYARQGDEVHGPYTIR